MWRSFGGEEGRIGGQNSGMSVRFVCSGFVLGVSWMLDRTFLENQGIRFVSKINKIPKLLCVVLSSVLRRHFYFLAIYMLSWVELNGSEELR